MTVDTDYTPLLVVGEDSAEDIYVASLKDISDELNHTSEEWDLERYMLQNLYSVKYSVLCGCRSDRMVLILRTTLKVEELWTILKGVYLLTYSCPRVYLLVYIIWGNILCRMVDLR